MIELPDHLHEIGYGGDCGVVLCRPAGISAPGLEKMLRIYFLQQ
jgi:hypothetical protein